jgi:hypothetical protein
LAVLVGMWAAKPGGREEGPQPRPRSGSPARSPAPLFARDAVWNTSVPADAPLDRTSGARVAALVRSIERSKERNIYPNIATKQYSTPLYIVPRAQAKVPVVLDAGPWADSFRRALADGVPIPKGATPAEGTDGHMTVYQQTTDTLWEFWRAVRRKNRWHASWGGAMQNVSKNPGYYNNTVWPGLAPNEGWNWGSTATSLPVAGGLMTMAELRRGRVDHALAIATGLSCASMFAFPAQRHDGADPSPTCMPEGARLRLDPKLDLDRLELPQITRIVARAAQRYGMILRDTTGGGTVSFYAEAPQGSRSSPYSGPDSLFGAVSGWKAVERFPWDRLQLLRMRLCTKFPCRPAPDGQQTR